MSLVIIQTQKIRADALASKTAHLATERWGDSWRALCLFLVRRGYQDDEVEAILRAYPNAVPDGRTAGDFKRWMRANPAQFTKQKIKDLLILF